MRQTICPPDYYQCTNDIMVTHALRHMINVTHCYYQLTKACSTSQTSSIIKLSRSDLRHTDHTECSNPAERQ